MRALGVAVALGQDCVMDPWYGLGGADMLDVAHMAVHAAPMTSREAIRWSFDAVTEIPARILGLEGYGLAVGCKADMVVLQAADPIEAVRLRAPRLAVIRRGEVLGAHSGAKDEPQLARPPGDARSRRLRAEGVGRPQRRRRGAHRRRLKAWRRPCAILDGAAELRANNIDESLIRLFHSQVN